MNYTCLVGPDLKWLLLHMLKSTLHVHAQLFDGIIKCDPKESVVLQDLCFNLLLKLRFKVCFV